VNRAAAARGARDQGWWVIVVSGGGDAVRQAAC
jgi:hypothetical protein